MDKVYQELELEEMLREHSLEDDTTTSSQEAPLGMAPTKGYPPFYDIQGEEEKHVGRRKIDSTKMFARIHTKGGKSLKKEYQRCQIIRGIKKCARLMATGKKPQKGIHTFDLRDHERVRIWQAMEQLVSHNPDLFTSLGFTCEGPATDGKIHRKRQHLETPKFRSFNDDYCRNFYKEEQVREFHYYYLLLVYGTGAVDPKSICEKMIVFCCDGCHSDVCTAIWEQVRNYLMFEMINQLGLKPFGTSDIFPTTSPIIEEAFVDSEATDPDSLLV